MSSLIANTHGCFPASSSGLTWFTPSGSSFPFFLAGSVRIARIGEASEAQISATQYSSFFFLLYFSVIRVTFTLRSRLAYCHTPFFSSSRRYSSPGLSSPARNPRLSKCQPSFSAVSAVSSAMAAPCAASSSASSRASAFRIVIPFIDRSSFLCSISSAPRRSARQKALLRQRAH